MSIKERNQDMHMVAELIQVHLPKTLNTLNDSALCKDICAVLAINLRRIAADPSLTRSFSRPVSAACRRAG